MAGSPTTVAHGPADHAYEVAASAEDPASRVGRSRPIASFGLFHGVLPCAKGFEFIHCWFALLLCLAYASLSVASATDRVVWGCRCIKPYQGPGPFTAPCTTQWTISPCAYTLQGRGCPLIVVQRTSTGIGSPPWTVPSAEAHTVQEQPRCAHTEACKQASAHVCTPVPANAARSPTLLLTQWVGLAECGARY